MVSAAPSTPIDLPIQMGVGFSNDFPLANFYECSINLLAECSKALGEAKTWSKYQPELQNLVNDWKKCYKGAKGNYERYVTCGNK